MEFYLKKETRDLLKIVSNSPAKYLIIPLPGSAWKPVLSAPALQLGCFEMPGVWPTAGDPPARTSEKGHCTGAHVPSLPGRAASRKITVAFYRLEKEKLQGSTGSQVLEERDTDQSLPHVPPNAALMGPGKTLPQTPHEQQDRTRVCWQETRRHLWDTFRWSQGLLLTQEGLIAR